MLKFLKRQNGFEFWSHTCGVEIERCNSSDLTRIVGKSTDTDIGSVTITTEGLLDFETTPIIISSDLMVDANCAIDRGLSTDICDVKSGADEQIEEEVWDNG